MAFCCAARQVHSAAPCRRCRRAPQCPIAQRNRTVETHLGLAHHVAERYIRASGCRGGAAPDDIHAAACAGLVRCVELFDAGRGHRLSSYAVPYVSGVIRHHLRDHWLPLKVPRRLLELQQRGRSHQSRRRRLGLPPLTSQQLALHLGVSVERLQEAEMAWLALQRIRSLEDLPPPAGEPDS